MKQFILTLILIITVSAQLSSFEIGCNICHDVVREYQKAIPRKPTVIFLNYIAEKVCEKKHI